ncbi:MAG: lamin tail domain-containing protein [Deltaproteobacteria bacterium]|nr:lamin tail domain-containing protein [Deltaproteobacteria bacterium]
MKFTSPPANKSYTVGDTVVATISVSNATLGTGAGEYKLQYFLDGVAVGAPVTTAASFTYGALTIGRRQLAVALVDQAGEFLPNPESLNTLYVKMKTTCGKSSDCDDGLSCSAQACSANVCNWGPIAGCCDHDLECAFGSFCVAGKCQECLDDTHCDDGDPCTTDTCGVSGVCFHESIAGCCNKVNDTRCNDDDACTVDSCNVATNSCVNTDNGDPLCCNTKSDCTPSNPCLAHICYINAVSGEHRCRYGPQEIGCCTNDTQCADANPCTLDACEYANISDEKGSCSHEPDPAKPACCLSKNDCDDNDLSTLDKCVSNVCVHEDDPTYCSLPPTSGLVINEMMVAPGGIDDALGEWFELYNSTSQPINLTGYTIETDAGQTHTLTAANAVSGPPLGLTIGAHSYYVLARNVDSTLNGGFKPQYQYVNITLPDKFESGADVTRTLTIKDASGTVIDSVTYNTATWPSVNGHSYALSNPFVDNSVVANWRAGGSNPNAAKNLKYGASSNNLYGTPKNANTDVFLGVLDPVNCDAPQTNACAEGRCGLDNQCAYSNQAGCCTTNADCNDYDSCTTDTCDVATNTCNPPVVDPLCCKTTADCDDGNPCNLDRCIGGTCRYSPVVVPGCCVSNADCDDDDACTVDACDTVSKVCKPGVPVVGTGGAQCCNHPDDCDDGDPATIDLCSFNDSPPICVSVPDPDYCNQITDACDDGVACTTDSCDVGLQKCRHELQPGCCTVNAQCPSDNDPCTAESCDTATGNCQSLPVQGCCISDNACDDGNVCTVDSCGTSHVCHHEAVAGCCLTSSDCDDGSSCTTDTCSGNVCTHQAQTSCCTPGGSQAVLVGQCGPDPDGPATCFQWECTGAGACNLLQNANCCSVSADCNDGDPCTTDICLSNKTCKHLQTTTGGCCTVNSNCPESDGNACTAPFCSAGLCGEAAIPGCSPSIEPPVGGGPGGGDPGTDPTSCWTNTTAGLLGPDDHASCVGLGHVVGAGAILSSFSFDPNNADDATVQFNMAWNNGAGTHTITVLATAVENDYSGAEVIDIVDASGSNPGTLYTYNLSNAMLAQNQVWIGWRVDSDTPDNIDVAVDDFIVGTGHAPFFVGSLQADKTYDRSADQLLSGGTITSALGDTKVKTFWSHDVEWNSQTLTYELLDAPSFVTIKETTKLGLWGVWQVKVQVKPTLPTHIGSYSVRLRVSDGGFTATLPFQIDVTLGAGYVLWAPGSPAEGDALATALDGAGVVYQRVTSLSQVVDFSQVRALFITAGGGSSNHVLTNSQVAPAIAFAEGGGHIYLEGSSTFAEDPQTALQQKMQVALVAQDGGLFGQLAGSWFHHPGTWAYTSDGAYLNDVDHLAPKIGSGARTVLHQVSDNAGLSIAAEDPSTGSRTYATSIVYSKLAADGAAASAYIADVLDFFQNGFGGCTVAAGCADGNACTIDSCVGGQCQNAPDSSCTACQADSDCDTGEVCKPNGDCEVPGGGEVGAGDPPPTDFNCDQTDEIIDLVKHTSGFKLIDDVNTHVKITLAATQKVGWLRVQLRHAGVVVSLLEPDPANTSNVLDATFDIGLLPAAGAMSDFDGTLLEGDWILTVENTKGGQKCGTVNEWSLFVTSSDPPACTVDADCDNGQACDGTEICNAGTCELGSALDCDDGNPCTLDVCDPAANNGAGACDHSVRAATCAGATCSGGNSIDAGDGQCGLADACVGGLGGATGTCTTVCPGCAVGHSGQIDTPFNDFQCVTAVVNVTAPNDFVSDVYVRADVSHAALGQLTVKVFSPDNTSATLLNLEGGSLANFHSTWPFSNPNPSLCSLDGVQASGLWKVQVCDTATGTTGVLHSASIWVDTQTSDPTLGQNCSNAVTIPVDGDNHTITGTTACYADSTQGSCSGGDGHDKVHSLVLPSPQRVRATLSTPLFNGALYVTDTCSSGSFACADVAPSGGMEVLDVHLNPGTWYLVVDALDEVDEGDYTLDVQVTELTPNGGSCTDGLDCESGHCQNGFCCGSGDCCAIATDCPAAYTVASVCNSAATCQGFRKDPACSANKCISTNVADDTGCSTTTVAKDCGLIAPLYCTGEQVQDPAQPCPPGCGFDDANCAPGAHCYEGTEVCRVDLPNGSVCERDGHCESGQCVDGVCCDTACDGQCEQCNKAGSVGTCALSAAGTDPGDDCAGNGTCGGVCDGSGGCTFTPPTTSCGPCLRCDGVGGCTVGQPADTDPDDTCPVCEVCNGESGTLAACVPVPSGQDPVDDCSPQGAASCQHTGVCNGASACENFASTTECVAQTCTNGFRDPAHFCDGLGTGTSCVDPPDEFCGGLACTADGLDCRTNCTQDSECITGYFCDNPGPTGTCEPKLANGDACNADNECTTNFCTDGVCCTTACAGACRQCDISGDGTCTLHPFPTDPETGCGLYWCNGTGACNVTCSVDSDCKAGNFCNGTTCEPKRGLGGECSGNNQCDEGVCNLADGVCCDGPCSRTCESCKLAGFEGTCKIIEAGQDPDEECAGSGTCGGACDGNPNGGSCTFPTAGSDCGTCKTCNGNGACISAPANTNPNSSCAGCQTCNGTGACKNVPFGTDFHDDCAATAQTSCGLDGQCDGNGACDYWGTSAVVTPASCTAGVLTLADYCDGAGSVADGGTQSCTPYICASGTACGTTCSSHAQCATGYFCDFNDLDGDGRTNDCVAKRLDGQQCNLGAPFECANGTCNNGGICCAGGGDCCTNSNNCQHLAVAPTCSSSAPGGCSGSRMDAYCNPSHVCAVTAAISDPSACATNLCDNAKCTGLTFTDKKYCDTSGGCTVGGTVFSCDDGNPCTIDSCNGNGTCGHVNDNGAQVVCYEGPAGTRHVGICQDGLRTCTDGLMGACDGQVMPAIETCNAPGSKVDEDCDGSTDEEGAEGCTVYFYDFDNDGVGVDDYKCLCEPTGFYRALGNGDCDDNNNQAKPGNTELCSTPFDDNCNSVVNEQNASGCQNRYFDGDSDGQGVGGALCLCSPFTAPYTATSTGDCNDGNNQVNSGATEICDGIDNNCNGQIDTAERSAAAMCGTPAHSTPGCNVNCYISNCDATWFNVDGLFSNGCEANPDSYDIAGQGNFCANDANTILVGPSSGMSSTPTSEYFSPLNTILPSGDVDWYRAYIQDNGTLGSGFSFEIVLSTNSGSSPGDFVFDLYEDSCSNLVCQAARTYRVATNFNHTSSGCSGTSPCGMQNCDLNANAHCTENLPSAINSWFYAKVYRRSGAPTAGTNTYQLRFRGGY